jgi:methylglyoxal synthase
MAHKELTMARQKRIAVVWNVPIACNRASADFIISSPLMDQEYQRLVTDFDPYRQRLKARGIIK